MARPATAPVGLPVKTVVVALRDKMAPAVLPVTAPQVAVGRMEVQEHPGKTDLQDLQVRMGAAAHRGRTALPVLPEMAPVVALEIQVAVVPPVLGQWRTMLLSMPPLLGGQLPAVFIPLPLLITWEQPIM